MLLCCYAVLRDCVMIPGDLARDALPEQKTRNGNSMASIKLYCYVDETGQDTLGRLFIVSVIITDSNREEVRKACKDIEAKVGKHQKWIRTEHQRQTAYIREILKTPQLHGRLMFAVFTDTTQYQACVVQAVANALDSAGLEEYKATVLIDALPKAHETQVASQLRRSARGTGGKVQKVRGIRKDENDILIRLADALCGFVRAASQGREDARALFRQGIAAGTIKDISEIQNTP